MKTLSSFSVHPLAKWLCMAWLALPMSLSAEPARVIVKYTNTQFVDTTPAQQRMSDLGLRSGMTLRSGRQLDALTHVVTAQGLSSSQLAEQLMRQPGVAYAVVDGLVRLAAPADPLYASVPLGSSSGGPLAGQWYLKAPSNEVVSAINAEAAWDITTGSPGITVALLDTGVRFDHSDFLTANQGGNLLDGWDFVSSDVQSNDVTPGRDADATDPGDWVTADDIANIPACAKTPISNSTWHGTITAGLIGAITDNNIGIAGLGRQVRVLPVRVIGKCAVYSSDLIAGARWAAGLNVPDVPDNPTPAQVINISLSGEGACNAAYRDAFTDIANRGAAVIAAAGNNRGHAVGAPANCPGVMAVASVRHAGTKVGYSDIGPEVILSAPGGNCSSDAQFGCRYPIVSTRNAGTTAPVTGAEGATYTDSFKPSVGTSMSAPLVAGTAALMLSVNPRLQPNDLRTLLQQSARPFPATGAESNATRQCQPPVATIADPDNRAEQLECYCTTTTCGAGMLDVAAAVQLAGTNFLPRISVSPNPATAGQALTLSAENSLIPAERSITAYRWVLLNGGGIASDFSVGADAASAGLNTSGPGRILVQLTLTDDQGRTATSSLSIDVRAPSSGDGGGALQPLALLALGMAAWALRRAQRTTSEVR